MGQMDHDHELLYEGIARPSRIEGRGPIAEFLAKKRAEQARETSSGYRVALERFGDFLGEEATVGDMQDAAGYDSLSILKASGLSTNTIATYFSGSRPSPAG